MTDVINYPNNNNLKVIKEENTDENICEICYGNTKYSKYTCGECDNSICINCVETCCKMNDYIKYSYKCPYCRNINRYNYEDLTKDELQIFYKNMRKRHIELKKPLNHQLKKCDDLIDDLLVVRGFLRDIKDTKKDKKEIKLIDDLYTELNNLKDKKYDIDNKIIKDYNNAKEEIEELKNYKDMYYSNQLYNENIKMKLQKQKCELEKQTENVRNMMKQNEMLIQQNKDLFNKVNDIYNIVNNKGEIRKPQQVIKTIANNIKEVIDTKPHLRIDIVLEKL